MNKTSSHFSFKNYETEILFKKSSKGGYGFLLETPSKGEKSFLPLSPFVRGKSFDLFPDKVISIESDRVHLSGKGQGTSIEGKKMAYPYQVLITSDVDSWVKFEVELTLPQTLKLDFENGFEPELTLDLGALPPYERGDHVWFITNVNNPTKWNDEEYGNDMPACYSYDPYLGREIQMFFDMTEMSWMGYENMSRFFCYRAGYRRNYENVRGQAEIGLYAVNYSGKELPKGKIKFVYYIKSKIRDEKVNPVESHEAVKLLVDSCLKLMPSTAPWPQGVQNWQETALGCAEEMNTNKISWRRDSSGLEYILNYVNGHSPAWKSCVEARGNSFDMDIPCIDTAAWTNIALDPLLLLKSSENPLFSVLQKRIQKFIQNYVEGGKCVVVPTKEIEKNRKATLGNWQYAFIIYTLWRTARFNKLKKIKKLLESEIDEVIIPSARSFQYLFPLLWDKITLHQVRSGDSHGINGIYATMMLDRYEEDPQKEWLEEAEKSIRTLYQLPINTIHQEVFLLGLAIHASCRLFRITNDGFFKKCYEYLLSQAFRQIYWFRDKNISDWKSVNIQGTFHACTPINYGALFENIEVLARVAPTFKIFSPSEQLLRVFNLNRINNFYYFPKYLPKKYQETESMYIPREDIPQFGGPESFVGQELYGAGHVFRSYTLWEAYAHADDRNIMVLNLDQYEERANQKEFSFIAFNPNPERFRVRILLPILNKGKGRLSWDDEALGDPEWVTSSGFECDLEPSQVLHFKIEK